MAAAQAADEARAFGRQPWAGQPGEGLCEPREWRGECGRVFVPENRNYSIAGLLSVDDCGTVSDRKPQIGIEFGARLRAEKKYGRVRP